MTRFDPVGDDLLLDRLGRGEPVADEGDVAAMLADWRATLPGSSAVDERLLAATLAATARRAARRLTRVSLGIATGVVLACGGVAVAAANAGPGSPLWPITQYLYGGGTESRTTVQTAEHAVAEARIAAGQGRFDDATRLLDEATGQLSKLDESEEVRRLRARLDAVRGLLPRAPVPASTRPDASVSLLTPTSGPLQPPPAPPTPKVASPPRPEAVSPTPSGTPAVPVPVLPVSPELVPDITPTK